MAIRKTIPGQIENRNFLAPTGFHFQIQRAPKVSYFGNMVNIPGITLGVAEQPTYLKDIPLPGDKMDFEDLTLRFLVEGKGKVEPAATKNFVVGPAEAGRLLGQ